VGWDTLKFIFSIKVGYKVWFNSTYKEILPAKEPQRQIPYFNIRANSTFKGIGPFYNFRKIPTYSVRVILLYAVQ
jgi:hypothetical protein